MVKPFSRYSAVALAGMLACSYAGAQTTLTTSGATYPVPPNVVLVRADVYGGGGGGGGADAGPYFGADGGAGSVVSAVIQVNPATTGTLGTVGLGGKWGQSRNGGGSYSFGGLGGAGAGAGGVGGTSANPVSASNYGGAGGGGGGGTSFSIGAVSIVAGGGGGGGAGSFGLPTGQATANPGVPSTVLANQCASTPAAGVPGFAPTQPSSATVLPDGGGGGGGGGGDTAGAGGAPGNDGGNKPYYYPNGVQVGTVAVTAGGGTAGGSCFSSGPAIAGQPLLNSLPGMAGGNGSKGTTTSSPYNPTGTNAATNGLDGKVVITPLLALTLQKAWGPNSKPGDSITVTTGGTNPATLTSTAGTNTTAQPVMQTAGGVINFPAETFSVGNPAQYKTTLSCTTNGVASVLSDPTGKLPNSLTVGANDTNIVCTYTNTPVPILGITKTSNGPWKVGQAGATYTIAVKNSGLAPTSGPVTVLEALPVGITYQSASVGWACTPVTTPVPGLSCSNPAAIAGGATSNLVLNIAVTTPQLVNSTAVNYASVGGGGDPNMPNPPVPGPTCSPASYCATDGGTPVSTAVAPGPNSGTATAGTASTAVPNVAIDDKINGQQATLGPAGNATVAMIGTWPQGITLDTQSGAVNVPATAQPGTYTMQYNLCDKSTPTPNCAPAIVTITVKASVVPQPDTGTATAGTASTAVPNVSTGDTINGQPATLGSAGNATVAELNGPWPQGITLDPTTGAVNVPATAQPGTYIMEYNLCDKSTPTPNCAPATVTITVQSATAGAGTAAPVPTASQWSLMLLSLLLLGGAGFVNRQKRK